MGEGKGLPDTNRRDLNRARAESADDELEACPRKTWVCLSTASEWAVTM